MTLYEIDSRMKTAFDAAIDPETGEILDEQMLYLFEHLQLDRDKKIENLGLFIKDLKAEAEMLGNEADAFARRKRSAERKAEWLKKYLEQVMNGERYKSTKVVISYMNYKSVQIDDMDAIPDEYKRVRVEPNKVDIKAALKDGEEIPGASLVESRSMVIK